jgi:hypothetical protein
LRSSGTTSLNYEMSRLDERERRRGEEHLLELLQRILAILAKPTTLKIYFFKGENMPASTVGTVALNQTIKSVVAEANAGGGVTFNPADISWSIADTTIASFVEDSSDGSATWTPLAAGSALITASDSTNPTVLNDVATLTVTSTTGPSGATSLTISFQPPVAS